MPTAAILLQVLVKPILIVSALAMQTLAAETANVKHKPAIVFIYLFELRFDLLFE
jgi:hypothetical protein